MTINNFMGDILLCTLIDITETSVVRGDSKERDQQRNWESVLQVLGLRTQPLVSNVEIAKNVDLTERTLFGSFYSGAHSIWIARFKGERPDFYSLDQLNEDFDQVPVILGLDETARFMLPMFHTHGTLKNIHFLLA